MNEQNHVIQSDLGRPVLGYATPLRRRRFGDLSPSAQGAIGVAMGLVGPFAIGALTAIAMMLAGYDLGRDYNPAANGAMTVAALVLLGGAASSFVRERQPAWPLGLAIGSVGSVANALLW